MVEEVELRAKLPILVNQVALVEVEVDQHQIMLLTLEALETLLL